MDFNSVVIKPSMNINLAMFFQQMHLIGFDYKSQFLVFRESTVRGIKVLQQRNSAG